jgi:hypothetical protein
VGALSWLFRVPTVYTPTLVPGGAGGTSPQNEAEP